MKSSLLIVLFLLVGCNNQSQDTDRTIFIQKLDALKFLSEYHDQLHVMIGEEGGDADKAFEEFSSALRKNKQSRSSRYFRIINEVPFFLLFIILIMVVMKPFY